MAPKPFCSSALHRPVLCPRVTSRTQAGRVLFEFGCHTCPAPPSRACHHAASGTGDVAWERGCRLCRLSLSLVVHLRGSSRTFHIPSCSPSAAAPKSSPHSGVPLGNWKWGTGPSPSKRALLTVPCFHGPPHLPPLKAWKYIAPVFKMKNTAHYISSIGPNRANFQFL